MAARPRGALAARLLVSVQSMQLSVGGSCLAKTRACGLLPFDWRGMSQLREGGHGSVLAGLWGK